MKKIRKLIYRCTRCNKVAAFYFDECAVCSNCGSLVLIQEKLDRWMPLNTSVTNA